MCKINCSGGCPECAPEDHTKVCVENYERVTTGKDRVGSYHCICGEMRCSQCPYRIKQVPGGRWVHVWPQMSPPPGTVADSPEWRAFTSEYGYELGLYVIRTALHRATAKGV